MVLPASQYSVLDAQRVERLEEGGGDTFRCHVGEMRFLSLQVRACHVCVCARGWRTPGLNPHVEVVRVHARTMLWNVAVCEPSLINACGCHWCLPC